MALDSNRAADGNEAREGGRAPNTFVLRVLGGMGGRPQLWLRQDPSESRGELTGKGKTGGREVQGRGKEEAQGWGLKVFFISPGPPGPASDECSGADGENSQKPGVWTASPSPGLPPASHSGEDTVPSQTPA